VGEHEAPGDASGGSIVKRALDEELGMKSRNMIRKGGPLHPHPVWYYQGLCGLPDCLFQHFSVEYFTSFNYGSIDRQATWQWCQRTPVV
jgi:hypothetical protein